MDRQARMGSLPEASMPGETPATLASAPGAVESAKPTPADLPSAALEVDRSLALVDGGVRNANERMITTFSQLNHEGVLHSVKAGHAASIRWVPAGQALSNGSERRSGQSVSLESEGRIERYSGGERMVYRGTYPDVDERYTVLASGGVEHDFVLRGRPADLEGADSYVFHGRLEMSRWLSVWDGAAKISGKHSTTGGLEFKDPSGNTVFRLERGIGYDAEVTKEDGTCDWKRNSEEPGRVMACRYDVELLGNGQLDLAIAVPSKWLADKDRAYPVVVDPNLGPGGLSDGIFNGGVPFYTGSVAGSNNFGIIAGGLGTPITFPFTCGGKLDDGAFPLTMPFNFLYYNIPRGPGTFFPILWIHTNGFATWLCPMPPCLGGCPVLCSTDEYLNQPIPSGNCPNDVMFPYFDDLRVSGQPGSGVYFTTLGPVGNRRLIVEWFKMGYVGGAANEVITFQLILYECQNVIQFNIRLDETEVDRGQASIGIEDPSGTIGIQFDFDSARAGPPDPSGQPTALEPLTPGTAVTFVPALAATLTVAINGQQVAVGQAFDPGTCIPFQACFSAQLTPPSFTCSGAGPSIPPSFGFQWAFTVPDPLTGGTVVIDQAFTSSFCKVISRPGAIQLDLTVIDSFGVPTNFGPITIQACDFPRIVLSADPQGGTVPLSVDFFSDSISDRINYQAFDDNNFGIPVGTTGLAPGAVVVDPGPNGILETRPSGDDVLDAATSTILAGPNGISETTALNGGTVLVVGSPAGLITPTGGDDVVVGNNIVDGGDGVAASTAVPPDLQLVLPPSPVGLPAALFWTIERFQEPFLHLQPAFYASMTPGDKTPAFIFTEPGLYKVTATWTGVDLTTNQPTFDSYSIYIFTESPNAPVDDNLVIERSTFNVAWNGKTDGPDTDPYPDDPERDLITISGTLSLPEITPSQLAGMRLRAGVTINGSTRIFSEGDGELNPNGTLRIVQPGGKLRSFSLRLPGGQFSIVARGIRLDQALGIRNVFDTQLLPVNIRIVLRDMTDASNPVLVYPQDPDSRGAVITYDYRSSANRSATGLYQLGKFTNDGVYTTAAGQVLGKTGGQQVLCSSAFLVKKARFSLKGSQVTCDVSGVMARFGGDDLRPIGLSDIDVSIGGGADALAGAGGFNETLNFLASPRWSVRRQGRDIGLKSAIFNFTRLTSALGKTGVQSLSWANMGGAFRIKTFPIDNAGPNGVGIDPAKLYQVVDLGLFIGHENDTGAGIQDFDGEAQFLVTRKGATSFTR
ncbi:MAG: hypothetical protein M5U26_01080 [Planctomycetota bacterium]|nr:hypothetical protein [Planctomycetota bacterium]